MGLGLGCFGVRVKVGFGARVRFGGRFRVRVRVGARVSVSVRVMVRVRVRVRPLYKKMIGQTLETLGQLPYCLLGLKLGEQSAK